MAAHALDDRRLVLRNDPKGMYGLACDFPAQCARALEIAREFCPVPPGDRPEVLLLTGLGGSAAGGDFVRAIVEHEGSAPFIVNRDYSVPKFVDKSSVVFACSYSGNTEETLSAYVDARSKGAHIVAVTSGGQLAAKAKEDDVPVILIPGGQPPRTALGTMLVPVLFTCEKWGVVPGQSWEATFRLLQSCVAEWEVQEPFEKNPAKQLAEALHGAVGILYGLGAWQGVVASRWRGQIEENAKNLAFSHFFPELNHNEILGWVGAAGQGVRRWSVVFLEDGRESEKMKARARVTKELVSGVAEVRHARAMGSTLLERMLSLALLGDFVSLYLASLNGVDPETIDWINKLKGELAKVPG